MAYKRNEVLNSIVEDFRTFSELDPRKTVQKVLNYSGTANDLVQRGDIQLETITFRLGRSTTTVDVNDRKREYTSQRVQATVYVDQGDTHDIKDARYARFYELLDILTDWANTVVGYNIDPTVQTVTPLGDSDSREDLGYISAVCEIELLIKIR